MQKQIVCHSFPSTGSFVEMHKISAQRARCHANDQNRLIAIYSRAPAKFFTIDLDQITMRDFLGIDRFAHMTKMGN